ncbi:MAG: hypothetical protein Q8P18_24285 [Pseudomonadota bacterium]|nr:hypothetical protein [Pseudomonadota bacterium]
MMHLLLAIACTTPDARWRVTPVAGGAVATTPSELDLRFGSEAAGFYELRAYRMDAAGVTWVGAHSMLGAVRSDTESVSLARVPLQTDGAGGRGETVVYAIALRAEDADAEPGLYLGLAAERLVFVGGSPPAGAAPGWNLARDYDSGAPVWLPLASRVVLDENLYAPASSDLASLDLPVAVDDLPTALELQSLGARAGWGLYFDNHTRG